MDIEIDEGVVDPKDIGEFKSVLDRLSAGKNVRLPDKIRIVRKLRGGKSNSEVYVAQYWPGKMAVIKIGPISELRKEYQNFSKYLKQLGSSNMFTPILPITPGLSSKHSKPTREREALWYEHVQNYDGAINNSVNFEIEAEQAINVGGQKLTYVQTALRDLFLGIEKALYIKHKKNEPAEAKSLERFWNLRFRADCVIEVDELIIKEKKLRKKNYNQTVKQVFPFDVFQSAVQINGDIKPDTFIEIRNLTVAWFGDRLMGEVFNKEKQRGQYFRIEIVTDNGQSISDLAKDMKEGSTFHVCGKVQSMRAQAHRCLLLKVFYKDLTERDDLIIGPDNNVIDPFICLADVLKRNRALTTLVHGDLNPRNILVVPHGGYLRPYLIDYALMNEDEPFFLDFVRLEVCLTRDVLPVNLNWAQHIRLQRLLSAACRLGNKAESYFAELLSKNNKQLASAFSLLLTIREESFKIYCKALNQNAETSREEWLPEYMEQLFLFAHVAFKWKKEDRALQKWKAALRATTTIAYVASECLFEKNMYCKWTIEDLQNDGLEIMRFINKHQETKPINLIDLSEMALALDQHHLKPDNRLEVEFEKVRAGFAKKSFVSIAIAIKGKFSKDHYHYIILRAFMDLKGSVSVSPGRIREQHSFEEMLKNDELLSESEQLRSLKGDESVLDIITRYPILTIIGDAGSGKSTIVNEWMYGLALNILDEEDPLFPKNKGNKMRLPIQLDAVFISDFLKKDSGKSSDAALIRNALKKDALKEEYKHLYENENTISQLLIIGALYIIVDALNELAEQKQTIADWITKLNVSYPRTSIIVCHREYNYNPRLLSFPVVTLQKVDHEMAKDYIQRYFIQNRVPNAIDHSDRLYQLLIGNPLQERVRDLTKTPLFLWMIAECYLKNKTLPTARGSLFKDFCKGILQGEYKTGHGNHEKMLFTFEEKAMVLCLFGHKLVQDRSTTLFEREIAFLIPNEVQGHWQELLSEIVGTRMLEHAGGGIRFLHQSFQEYFAARYFIEHEATDPALIEERVRRFGWHETFIVLIGFADESPDVVNHVIEIALKHNPILTARCLRMAEAPDPELLNRFIQTQKDILKDSEAGSFSYNRAAQTLIEYGINEALAVLFDVAGDPDAPIESRVEILNQLAEIPYN